MDHRTSESTMEWEYNGQGPMDPESPFATFTNQNRNAFASNGNGSTAATSVFGASPNKPLPSLPRIGSQRPNGFGATPRTGNGKISPTRGSSIFDRSFQNAHPANPFLNPAFTTPRKPFDEGGFSEMSGAESSPAATDADISEIPVDSPDIDQFNNRLGLDTMGLSPSRGSKAFMYGKSPGIPTRKSGKGGISRGKYGHLDKIRKRKRHNEDRDVGTVRHRIESEVSDSDSADDTDVVSRVMNGKRAGSKGSKKPKQGWIGGFLSVITTNPTAPDVLVRWLQLFLQSVVMSMVLYFLWNIVLSLKHDMYIATEQARSERLGNITQCATNYHDNKCFPREQRLPRLIKDCDEWDICMNQDAGDIQTITVGVKQFAELLNELVSTMHYKTIGFLGGLIFLAIFALRAGSGNPPLQPTTTTRPNAGLDKAAIGGGLSFANPPADPNQAYIWAPIPTPHRLKASRVLDEGTDTDASPDTYRTAIMPPPETPSRRRSPSKEKWRPSPVKKSLRSPTKGY